MLAVRSGQPLVGPSGLESWHPRDVDTLEDIYMQQASEARLAALRQQVRGG